MEIMKTPYVTRVSRSSVASNSLGREVPASQAFHSNTTIYEYRIIDRTPSALFIVRVIAQTVVERRREV